MEKTYGASANKKMATLIFILAVIAVIGFVYYVNNKSLFTPELATVETVGSSVRV